MDENKIKWRTYSRVDGYEKADNLSESALIGMLDSWPGNLRVDLRRYLLDHESDIAHGINDFDELKNLFRAIFGRLPERI